MMELDKFNNLNEWPLKNINEFIMLCKKHLIKEIFLTGTNTDPLLFKHHEKLTEILKENGFIVGIRTNGTAKNFLKELSLYDKGSLTICSTNHVINKKMMGGEPPNISAVLNFIKDLKVNIVLGNENIGIDIWKTINNIYDFGIRKVNLREPYGQPHIGWESFMTKEYNCNHLGMPQWFFKDMLITYWDVHYVEVESVNLYASGRISEDYPITRGYSEKGSVMPQYNFRSGRHNKQWI